MTLSKPEHEVLLFLAARYKDDADHDYDVSDIIKKHGLDPSAGKEIVEKLKLAEYLKPDRFVSGNEVKCAISMRGISQVDPGYVEEKILAVIKGLGAIGGFGNLMKILGYGRDQHQRGFDLANEMQNRDYIKLLYASYTQNVISVEMLLPGKHIYDRMKK